MDIDYHFIANWMLALLFYCSVTKSCLTLCYPMDCSMPGFLVLHYLPEFAQTHVHWIGEVFQPSHPLLTLSLPALHLSQHQHHFQCFGCPHQVPKVLSFQHQSSNEYSKLIFFKFAWFDLLVVQVTVKSLLQHHNSKATILWHSVFFMV